MGLYERLLEEDKEQLWKYLDWYSEGGNKTIPKDKLDFFLRYWNNSKNTFFKAFNEEFIIKKEIRITKQNDELACCQYHPKREVNQYQFWYFPFLNQGQ